MSEPEETALYHVYGVADRPLYIGVSKDFGRRWKQHAKKHLWWNEKRWMTTRWYPSRSEAEAAEVAAIKTEGPKYNRMHSVIPSEWLTDCSPRLGPLRLLEPSDENPSLMTATSGLATYLQIPEETIATWRSWGFGPPHVFVGNEVRYIWADVDTGLAEQPGPRTSRNDAA